MKHVKQEVGVPEAPPPRSELRHRLAQRAGHLQLSESRRRLSEIKEPPPSSSLSRRKAASQSAGGPSSSL